MARCKACRRFSRIDDHGLCPGCDTPQERDIVRLLEAWEHDLELLMRFDAFYAARERAA
jgi:hypothetical protein